MRLIDADALLDFLDVGHLRPPTEICFSELMMKNIIDIQPTVDAVPSQLTNEEIKTIRIHMNAFKEKLCNQHRYKEADEYQQIVDKLDTMMDAVRKEE